MWVELGNDSHLAQRRADDGRIVAEGIEGQFVTRVEFLDSYSVTDAINDIVNPGGVVTYHFVQGAVPAWIDSDNDELRTRLAAWYGLDLNTSRPSSWGNGA